jgi:hypothetical protein
MRVPAAGEPVVVMGPTGTPTEIPHGTDVMLAGGGLGNAVLFSIAKALRGEREPRALLRRLQERRGPVQARGHRSSDRSGDLEHRHGGDHRTRAPQDSHFRGNIVRRWWRMRGTRRRAARAAVRRDAHHCHRFGSDDGGRQGGALRACSPRISGPITSASPASTRRCSA